MDITSFLAFITGGSVVATLLMSVFKKAIADISVRWGSLITQVALFVLCILIALVMWAFQFVPANILVTASLIFSGAITLYEVFYKAFFQEGVMGVSQK